jgi:hypothetical protein
MSNWQAYQDYLRWYLKYEGDDPLTYEEWFDELFNQGIDRHRSRDDVYPEGNS